MAASSGRVLHPWRRLRRPKLFMGPHADPVPVIPILSGKPCHGIIFRMKEAEELVALLLERGEMVATAESCTGGLVSAALTDVAGASACYPGGIVSYANEVKHRELGVPTEILETCGAVSAECASAMAAGVRIRFGTDWSVVTTGIAGPGGGTPEKPVGLVYIGVAGPGGVEVSRNLFPGDRAAVRAATVCRALGQLLERVRAASPAPSSQTGGGGIVRAASPTSRGRDEARPSRELSVRHHPSRNSLHVGNGDRATILFGSVKANKKQCVFGNPSAVSRILSTWNSAKKWLAGRHAAMSDHVHFRCAPGRCRIPYFHKWMKHWKDKAALSFPTGRLRSLGQRQFGDAQLRQGESLDEKRRFMVGDPVREGLVPKAEDRPCQGVFNVFSWNGK